MIWLFFLVYSSGLFLILSTYDYSNKPVQLEVFFPTISSSLEITCRLPVSITNLKLKSTNKVKFLLLLDDLTLKVAQYSGAV